MFVSPMPLVERDTPFDDERYIFEPKIDGHRLILSMENGIARLYTRHNHEVTSRYPELLRVPILDNTDVVLDGEVACLNPATGTIDYESMIERYKLRKPMSIREAAIRQPVHYFVFDILRYEGQDLRSTPLVERKKILERALSSNRYMSPLLYVEGTGIDLFETIRRSRLEGIVAKAKSRSYVDGEDVSWMKIMNYERAVFQIAGYRKNQFGWLLRYQDRNVGILEQGVPSAHKNAFYGVSKSLKKDEDRDFVYVEPSIQARVRFRHWTREGTLRSPEFVDFVVS
ncbi:ATP-dependent DNA ligase [Cohnella herbarum]|uniref:ATP-dependent DNA ligase n=1 Tax=Cohnella herbarum TaxID=2728023 RepID=A0A7Z2VRK5_9BACL|nr:ATP-dependent DNA ligase [Cohnella herbarum]